MMKQKRWDGQESALSGDSSYSKFLFNSEGWVNVYQQHLTTARCYMRTSRKKKKKKKS